MVEAAIVTPLFFLLIFGIFEFGLLFRNHLTTRNATKQGARALSVSGQRPDADYLMLRSVEHGVAAMGLGNLDYVIVFLANGPDDTVPTACRSASQADLCNRYVPADFALEIDNATGGDIGNFRCSGSALDRHWCPVDRGTSLTTGVDYVGLHIQTTHNFITGFFGGTRTLNRTTILRLEPQTS